MEKLGHKLSLEILRGAVGWCSQKPPKRSCLLAQTKLYFGHQSNSALTCFEFWRHEESKNNHYLWELIICLQIKHKLFEIFIKPQVAQAYYQMEIQSRQIKLAYSNWQSYHSYEFSTNCKMSHANRFIFNILPIKRAKSTLNFSFKFIFSVFFCVCLWLFVCWFCFRLLRRVY